MLTDSEKTALVRLGLRARVQQLCATIKAMMETWPDATKEIRAIVREQLKIGKGGSHPRQSKASLLADLEGARQLRTRLSRNRTHADAALVAAPTTKTTTRKKKRGRPKMSNAQKELMRAIANARWAAQRARGEKGMLKKGSTLAASTRRKPMSEQARENIAKGVRAAKARRAKSNNMLASLMPETPPDTAMAQAFQEAVDALQ